MSESPLLGVSGDSNFNLEYFALCSRMNMIQHMGVREIPIYLYLVKTIYVVKPFVHMFNVILGLCRHKEKKSHWIERNTLCLYMFEFQSKVSGICEIEIFQNSIQKIFLFSITDTLTENITLLLSWISSDLLY